MATWQFDMHCVPRQTAERQFGDLQAGISRGQQDDVDWWGETGIEPVATAISEFLPPLSSWSPDRIRRWGQDDGDRIDLFFEHGHLHSVFVRFDVRSLSRAFVNDLIGWAVRADLVFLTPEGHFIRPSVEALVSAIEGSNAAHFVDDPRGFLDGLSKQP